MLLETLVLKSHFVILGHFSYVILPLLLIKKIIIKLLPEKNLD